MHFSIQDELQSFAEELQRYVTPVFLEELAREIGFIKRKRKLSGSDLATICIWVLLQSFLNEATLLKKGTRRITNAIF